VEFVRVFEVTGLSVERCSASLVAWVRGEASYRTCSMNPLPSRFTLRLVASAPITAVTILAFCMCAGTSDPFDSIPPLQTTDRDQI